MGTKRGRAVGFIAALMMLLGIVVAGCGESGGGSTSGGSTEAGSTEAGGGEAGGGEGTTSAATLKEAEQWLSIHQDAAKLPYKIPQNPPKAEPNKKVIVITAGAASEGSRIGGEGVKEGGEVLGWHTTIIDGQLNPEVWNSAMNNAISAKPDAIVLSAIPPEAVAGPIEKAAAEGIKVLTQFNPVKPSELLPGVLADMSAGGYTGGMAQAAWVAVHSGGKAKIIFYEDETLALTRVRIDGFNDGLEKFCPGCEVLDRYKVDETTMSETLEGQMSSDIQRLGGSFTEEEPGYVVAPHDAASLLMFRGINDAQAGNKVKLVSQDSAPAALQYIREGTAFVANWAEPLNWVGWNTADQLNRIFAGEPESAYEEANYVLQEEMLDQENINPSGRWYPPFDYKAALEKLWTSAG